VCTGHYEGAYLASSDTPYALRVVRVGDVRDDDPVRILEPGAYGPSIAPAAQAGHPLRPGTWLRRKGPIRTAVEVRRLRAVRAACGRQAWRDVEYGLVRNGWTAAAYRETVQTLAEHALRYPAALTDSRLADDPTRAGVDRVTERAADLLGYIAWACDGGCHALPAPVTRAWLTLMVTTPNFGTFANIRRALTDREGDLADWMTGDVVAGTGVLGPACWAAGLSRGEAIETGRAGRLSFPTLVGMAALRGNPLPVTLLG
jgi:hypothetical protein